MKKKSTTNRHDWMKWEERRHIMVRLSQILLQYYNPNSTTSIGWGQDEIIGRKSVYPIWFVINGKEERIWNEEVMLKMDKKEFMSGFSKFGSNQLLTMKNIDEMLDYLEKWNGLKI